jgi:hypothetical protein
MDLAREPDPFCQTFQFGKAHKCSHKCDVGHTAREHHCLGDGVSSDSMEAGCLGRPMTTGGLPTSKHFKYCSFWVDHFSRFIYVTFYDSKKAEELAQSKLEFEDFASRFQVRLKSIPADNGVYRACSFQDACQRNQQRLTFCAVGMHWQNGIAEQFIGSITQQARTILLHAMARWPQVVFEDMWPFAIPHAVTLHNCSVHKDKPSSPFELFTGQ